MEYVKGDFVQYKALIKIHLGQLSKDITPGQVVGFDGSDTLFGGQVHNITSIPGAIRMGWLVPVDDNISKYIPKPSGIQVSPATSSNQERGKSMSIERAVDDERQVGSLADSNTKRDTATANQFMSSAQVSNNQNDTSPALVLPPVASMDLDPPRNKYTIVHEESPVDITYNLKSSTKVQDVVVADQVAVDDSQNDGARPVAVLRPASYAPVDITNDGAVNSELRSLDPISGGGVSVKKVVSSRTNADADGGVSITQNHPKGATGDVPTAMSGNELSDIIPGAVTTGRPRPGVSRA